MTMDEHELRGIVRDVLAEMGWPEGGRREGMAWEDRREGMAWEGRREGRPDAAGLTPRPDGTSRQPGPTPVEEVSEGSVRGWSGAEDGGRVGVGQPGPGWPGLAQPGAAYTVREKVESVEVVSLRTDADLHAFVLRLLHLFENPGRRDALRAGRLRFRLTPGGVAGSVGAARRVEKGAVTEAMVVAAKREGARLVLGRRAVLTPLARDRARASGVEIERER